MNVFPGKTLESTEPHSDQTQENFSIRQLAEKTHVGTSTLRAWERRYGYPFYEETSVVSQT